MNQNKKIELEDRIESDDIPQIEKTEMGEIFENLDSDKLDKDTRMSNIDFNTRLSNHEINCCTVIDELTRLSIFPEDTALTRTKKRLNISRDGLSRQEKVTIASAGIERKSGSGMMGGLKNLFTPQPQR